VRYCQPQPVSIYNVASLDWLLKIVGCRPQPFAHGLLKNGSKTLYYINNPSLNECYCIGTVQVQGRNCHTDKSSCVSSALVSDVFTKFGSPTEVLLARNMLFDKIEDWHGGC